VKAPAAAFGRFISGLNGIGTLLIFGLMMLVTADVTLRFVVNKPIPGVVEIVEMSIVGIVFLQLTHAMAAGKMIRADTLLGILLVRAPRWGHALDACGQLVGAVLMAVILYGQIPRLTEAWTEGSFKGNPGLFTAPTWPLELMIALGCGAALVQFLVQLASAVRGWRRNERTFPALE
jgi:TRAP-type mannitol/chloroaromatic compound transport system permease small subunit